MVRVPLVLKADTILQSLMIIMYRENKIWVGWADSIVLFHKVISAAVRADTMWDNAFSQSLQRVKSLYLNECNIRSYSIDTYWFGFGYFNLPRIFPKLYIHVQ